MLHLLSVHKRPETSVLEELQVTPAIMGQLDLTVQVLHLSPKATPEELIIFFSYCGTVENLQLWKNKDQSQSALVTFSQPYAFQTALLLNHAVFAGQPILVLPSQDIEIYMTSPGKSTDENEGAVSKGVNMLYKTKHELEEKYKLSEKGRVVVDQTRSAINSAEQAAEYVSIAIKDNVSAGAMWLSGALDRASKFVSSLGTRKRDNPNSRKQK